MTFIYKCMLVVLINIFSIKEFDETHSHLTPRGVWFSLAEVEVISVSFHLPAPSVFSCGICQAIKALDIHHYVETAYYGLPWH